MFYVLLVDLGLLDLLFGCSFTPPCPWHQNGTVQDKCDIAWALCAYVWVFMNVSMWQWVYGAVCAVC